MKKMIIFFSLLVILFIQINYKSQAQIVQPTQPPAVVNEPAFPNPYPTSPPTNIPDTGPIQAGPTPPKTIICGGAGSKPPYCNGSCPSGKSCGASGGKCDCY